MLRGQVKTETHSLPQREPIKDEALVGPELRGNRGEDNREAADEVHIPDYVMYDFGLCRRIRCDR